MWISPKWSKATETRILTIFLLVTAVTLTTVLPLSAQQSPFEPYVGRIASDIEAQRKKFLFPRILVIEFPFSVTGVENLSSYLADDLSHSLQAELPSGTVIPRTQLREFLLSHRFSPTELISISVASWAADNLGANEIIYGEIVPSEDALNLNLRLVRLGDANEAANWSLSLPLTDQLKAQKDIKPAWHLPPDVKELALRCTSDGQESNIKAFIEAGGAMPKVTYAPNPPYPEEARKQKLQGTRSYDVFIDEIGRPVLVVPHIPVKPAFDDIAVETLSKWKIRPATMNGKPVPVCILMEVKWRLYSNN